MQDKNQIVLLGYSGHGYVISDAANLSGKIVTAYCDVAEHPTNPFKLKYLGSERGNDFDWKERYTFILGIGDNKIRVQIGDFIISKNKDLGTIIHPQSIVSLWSSIGKGAFVNASATVNAFAAIGDMCIINTGAIVEHECILGKGVHLAPGAVLAGNVTVGERTFIGANSVIKQGVRIGANVIIGAGSVVIRDIPDNEMWAGNPAKKMK